MAAKPQAYTPPPVKRAKRYDYHEIMDYLEDKYKFQSRDYYDSHSHFGKWADAKGYKANMKDPEGKQRNSSQIWFAEYRADPEGEAKCPEYADFWHWLLDATGGEIHNGCQIELTPGDWLEDPNEFNQLDDPKYEFVKTILGYMKDEFGDSFEVWIEW